MVQICCFSTDVPVNIGHQINTLSPLQAPVFLLVYCVRGMEVRKRATSIPLVIAVEEGSKKEPDDK